MSAVLVVDNDPMMLEMLCALLQRSHRVLRAGGAAAALGILGGDAPVDLLLTEVQMPGMSGFGLARLARRQRPSLKVLYLSGAPETAEVMRDPGERHGKLLNKTISALDLILEIDRTLKW